MPYVARLELLAKLPQPEGFVDSVRRAFSIWLRSGDQGFEAIAFRLGVAPHPIENRDK